MESAPGPEAGFRSAARTVDEARRAGIHGRFPGGEAGPALPVRPCRSGPAGPALPVRSAAVRGSRPATPLVARGGEQARRPVADRFAREGCERTAEAAEVIAAGAEG